MCEEERMWARKGGETIGQFFNSGVEEELDSILPRGTITYSHNNGSHQTTIDLVLATPGL
jgi:hypothetical protein